MIKTFTQNDLIRYIYQETNEQENIEIEEALLFDNKLFDTYRRMMEVSEELNRFEKSPSEKVINKILNYSKSINLHSVK